MLALTPIDADPRQALGVQGAGTLHFHLQGLGRLSSSKTAGDIQGAIDAFELGCRTEPESGVLRAALADAERQMYYETRDTQWLTRASASAREAVALESRAETQSSLAFTLSAMKDRAGAAAAFEQAHAFDPTDNQVNYQMGRNYGRLGQPEREKAVYRAAIRSRPHCWQPYWWLATWHYRQGNVDSAIVAYRDMIERSPDLYKGYTSLGGLLVLDGDYTAAVEALEHSLRLRPTRSAFSNLGTAHFNLRDFQSAVDAYNQAFQFGFADYELWLNLGDAYHWLKDRADQATDAYEQAVRLAQEERERRSRRGNTYDVMIPAHLASIYPKLGHPDSARVYLAEAIDAGGGNPMVQYHAALTYWQLAEPDSALDWLEKSVAGGYPSVWLRDSAVFDAWRSSQRFRRIAREAATDAP
jgi:tetratricopeptide (TPR) repeat protein